MPRTLFSFTHGKKHPLKTPIAVSWAQCDPSCTGWLHMNDADSPSYVERCDECQRFKTDDDARAAHAAECPLCH